MRDPVRLCGAALLTAALAPAVHAAQLPPDDFRISDMGTLGPGGDFLADLARQPSTSRRRIHRMHLVNAPRHLTLRNVPPEVAQSLRREARKRGTSINQTAVDLLRGALGIAGRRSNGLRRLAGAWSAEELARFEAAVQLTEGIDEELWR